MVKARRTLANTGGIVRVVGVLGWVASCVVRLSGAWRTSNYTDAFMYRDRHRHVGGEHQKTVVNLFIGQHAERACIQAESREAHRCQQALPDEWKYRSSDSYESHLKTMMLARGVWKQIQSKGFVLVKIGTIWHEKYEQDKRLRCT